MKKVVAYCRFSSDNQRTESIDAQVRAIKEYCINKKFELIKIYKDEGISGTSTQERESFLQMIKDSKNKTFEYVIVHKFDRFARNRYDHIIFEKKLEDNGVKLLSVLENLTDSPESIILKSVLTGMNEYYSLNLAREVRKGQKENALKCVSNGGITPLGYDLDENRHYVLNLAEVEIVKKIFEMYLDGYGYALISEELNKMGYKNKRGKPFKKLSIRSTLLNEKYTGTYIFGKRDEHGRLTNNEIRIENGIPAIIDKTTFEKVLIRMKNRKRGSRNTAINQYLLTGLCYCGECGGTYSGGYKSVNRDGTKNRGYLCRNRKDKVNDCKNRAIRKEILEDLVIESLKKNIFSPYQIEVITDKVYNYLVKNFSDSSQEIKKINARIEVLIVQKDKILDYNLNGVLNDEDFFKKKAQIEDEILDLKEKRLNIEENSNFLDRDKIRKYLVKLSKKIELSNETVLQNIIFTFIEKIIIYNDRISIDLRLFPIQEKPAKIGGDETLPSLAVKLEFITNKEFYQKYKKFF